MLNTRTLKHINERPRKAMLLLLAGEGAGVAALGAALLVLAASPLTALAAVAVGALAAFAAHRAVRARMVTTLDYDHLSGEAAAHFSTITKALEALASSEAIWRLSDGAGKVSGASDTASAPERTPVRVGQLDTPGIRAGLPIWGIEVGGESLMFFPEALLVYRDDRYEGVSYGSVRVDLSFVRFLEKKKVPEDAEVVEGPRVAAGAHLYRYAGAPRIPIVLYGLVEIMLPRNRQFRLQVSSLGAAARFAGACGVKEPQHERGGAYKPSAVEKRAAWAHEVLGVREETSMEEISAIYRKLACTYHPDKVLELPAEAREISERRMKEINAAYVELKRRERNPAQAR
jgi:hypothetical protein